MAFFDDLGKKISQAGQTAVQKTKEMTEIARINGLISDEEKKVNNGYYQIGKLYFTIHQNDYESAFGGMVVAICDAEAKIKDYKQQIQEIKGVVRCENCGAEVANNVAFCSACGAPMPKQDQAVSDNSDLVKCDGCGALIDKNMRFCTSCGKPTMDVAKTNNAPEITVQPVTVEVRKCPNCGAEIDEESAFCTECGTKIS